MQSADSAQTGTRPRFPALDPEPPARSWWRAGAVATVIVLLAGLGSWLGYSLSRTAPHHTPISVSTVRGLAGVVLAETLGSYLSETDMRTGHVVVIKNLGQFSSFPPPAVSPDGKYLFDSAVSRLVSLSSPGHPQIVPNELSFSASGAVPDLADYPWTAHDNGLVEPQAGPAGYFSTTAVAVVESVRTGQAVSLGPADSVAGDPQQEGAFIAVPSAGQALPDGSQPDAGIVLADAGSPTRMLVTTSQLERALGVKDGTAVILTPNPNPQGSMVAVDVVSTSSEGNVFTEAGVVVLSRTGALLGSQPRGSGYGWWSHSGSTLAFVSRARARPALTEWTIGGRSVTTALRDTSNFGPGACIWSPDDTSLICDSGPPGAPGRAGSGAPETWLVIRSATVSVMAGHGQPLLWTDGRLGR